jgi:hypothetical protein
LEGLAIDQTKAVNIACGYTDMRKAIDGLAASTKMPINPVKSGIPGTFRVCRVFRVGRKTPTRRFRVEYQGNYRLILSRPEQKFLKSPV